MKKKKLEANVRAARLKSLARVRDVTAELREENQRAEWRKFYASEHLERNAWPKTWWTVDPVEDNPRMQRILANRRLASGQTISFTASSVLTVTTASSSSSTNAAIKLNPGP